MTDSKFVFKDDLCVQIKNHEKSENKRRNMSSNIEIYSSERATECERKMLYEIFTSTPSNVLDGYSDLRQELRHKWASLMFRMPNVILHGVSVPLHDAKYNLTGTADMLLEFENLGVKAVGMVRDIDSEQMQQIRERGPFRKHVVSDMLCMWMAEIPHGIMIYEDPLKKDVEIFRVIAYNPIIQRAKEKFLQMEQYRILGRVMDRPHKSMNDKECESCVFKQKCWKE